MLKYNKIINVQANVVDLCTPQATSLTNALNPVLTRDINLLSRLCSHTGGKKCGSLYL